MNPLLPLWRTFKTHRPLVLLIGQGKGGGGDEDWTRSLQLAAPDARLERLDGLVPLMPWLAERGVRRADLLRVADVQALEAAEDLFFKNRIEAVSFTGGGSGGDSGGVGVAALLTYHQFHFFTADEAAGSAGVKRIAAEQIEPGREVLGLHSRFGAPQVPGAVRLDLPNFFKRFSIPARGVIHIGGHEGLSLDLYASMGFTRVLYLEANPVVQARLTARTRNRQGVLCLMCAASDSNGMEILHLAANDEQSSIMPLGKGETGRGLVAARRLDHLLREIGHNPADYNFLHLDIGGAELKALRGAVETLPGIDAISTAVHYEELCDGCPVVEDVDDFLEPFAFQRMYTATPASPARGDAFYLRKPAVTMRNLGQWGRLGNQVFEYAFVRIFAKRHRLHLATGRWPGNQLFGANDPLVDPNRPLPQHLESTYALKDSQIARLPYRPINFDACGVFQYHTAYYAPHKELFRKILQPVPALKTALDDSLNRVRDMGRTLVALHLRRGDYGYGLFFVPPNEWYQRWLSELWPTLESPLLYIATDEPAKVVGDFKKYQPVTAGDLKFPPFGADYYPDFYVLTQADHLAISNSSFSFAACMLNERSRTFLRPDLFARRLTSFDPWDAEPLLHRELGILDYKIVEEGVPRYLQNPADVQSFNAVRNWRGQYADSWSLIKGEQLETVLSMDLWTGYNLIRKANIRGLPLVEGELQLMARIESRMAEARGADAIGPYIAATMYAEASKLPAVDLSRLPAKIQEVIRS